MIKRWVKFAVAISVPCLLASCDKARETFGLEKMPPDEYQVVTRAPLAMPPDYGLRAPAPGTQRPQETQPSQAARDILLQASSAGTQRDQPPPRGLSPGESALLAKANALQADPKIRDVIDRETSMLSDADKSFVDSLLFWQAKEPPGVVIDPQKEQQRLQEASALGQTPSGPPPVIERKQKGWLEGIF